MKLSHVERRQLMSSSHPTDPYSDAELEAMSWRQLGALVGYHYDTVRRRVTVGGMTRRQACKVKRQQGLALPTKTTVAA